MNDGHYFSPSPSTRSERRELTMALPDLTLRLTTDRGVFSTGRIDPGTKILLSEGPELGSGTMLDLGCGYGPIACALARRSADATVWAVDVNERARRLCRDNAVANGCRNVSVALPAEVPASERFDEIWSNPPIRIGKDPLRHLLVEWLVRLKPTGRAVLVVQRNLGADSLAAWLETQSWAVERLVSRQGYRILEVRPA